ncbi:MAG: hypothetical protein AB7N91_18275 [Candidatus Tectimicrobiota bacterium]
MGVVPTHMGVDPTHIDHVGQEGERKKLPRTLRTQDIVAASHFRSKLTHKARQVLAYLDSIRCADNLEFTMPVGYGKICSVAGLNTHYLRREVLPKLTMAGLIGIVHKAMEGTTYRLHYDSAFLHLVTDDNEISADLFSAEPSAGGQQPTLPLADAELEVHSWPAWIDRDVWPWLTLEHIQQLIAKAGSEVQAQEKLSIILYNETHGPEEKRVRDRRGVLMHYLRTSQADIWANDQKYETLAMRRARQERDLALQEKALAEEAIRTRQEASRLRFVAALSEAQFAWIRQEAKTLVDQNPDYRFSQARYNLYKAEEVKLLDKWAERMSYGETVPSLEDEATS